MDSFIFECKLIHLRATIFPTTRHTSQQETSITSATLDSNCMEPSSFELSVTGSDPLWSSVFAVIFLGTSIAEAAQMVDALLWRVEHAELVESVFEGCVVEERILAASAAVHETLDRGNRCHRVTHVSDRRIHRIHLVTIWRQSQYLMLSLLLRVTVFADGTDRITYFFSLRHNTDSLLC